MIPDINANRLLNTFMELCSIDAEPTQERAMADHLTALLTGLGFAVTPVICMPPCRGPDPVRRCCFPVTWIGSYPVAG